jgi:hypothetical protein
VAVTIRRLATTLGAALLAGCVTKTGDVSRSSCPNPVATTQETAIRIALKAAAIENPDAFRFKVTRDEKVSSFFVMIFEKRKPDDFFAMVTVDSCTGAAELRGPL